MAASTYSLGLTDDQATKYIVDEKKQAKSDAEDDATMDGLPDGPPMQCDGLEADDQAEAQGE